MAEANFVVFSAGRSDTSLSSFEIAQAIATTLSLEQGFHATLWTEIFEQGTVQLAVEQFLKKLLQFDAAVVVLGADNIQKQANGEVYVPRDNVVFELGASLSRLGKRKTFLVSPRFAEGSPQVRLPSYLLGVQPLNYHVQLDLDQEVKTICSRIRDQFNQTPFGSDLPAVGLAYGYFNNFVAPTYRAFRSGPPQLKSSEDIQLGVTEESDFILHIVLPNKPLNRDIVQDLFTNKNEAVVGKAVKERLIKRKHEFGKVELHLKDGRDISIYMKKRTAPGDPFEIYDVPTTLLTSWNIIERVAFLFGSQPDEKFQEMLWRKEIGNFRLTLEEQISSMEGRVKILDWKTFITRAFEIAY